jgi:hypothetical protein
MPSDMWLNRNIRMERSAESHLCNCAGAPEQKGDARLFAVAIGVCSLLISTGLPGDRMSICLVTGGLAVWPEFCAVEGRTAEKKHAAMKTQRRIRVAGPLRTRMDRCTGSSGGVTEFHGSFRDFILSATTTFLSHIVRAEAMDSARRLHLAQHQVLWHTFSC